MNILPKNDKSNAYKSIHAWCAEALQTDLFSDIELHYLQSLPDKVPPVEWVWNEMDKVWLKLGLDNSKPLAQQPIGDFYSHPVWLMNGLFSRVDEVSANHRQWIARHFVSQGFKRIADFGGGLGELAACVISHDSTIRVDVVEPFPTAYAKARFETFPQVRYVSKLTEKYDAVVAQDVLEHVEDPIGLAFQLASTVTSGGQVIFANCFYPVIQCHLPSTFHLRHTFTAIMRAMGLKSLGSIEGAPHVQVYRRVCSPNLMRARFAEFLSKRVGPMINLLRA